MVGPRVKCAGIFVELCRAAAGGHALRHSDHQALGLSICTR